MKKIIMVCAVMMTTFGITQAQKKNVNVPPAVKTALKAKYPEASKVTWETEKGNYEANWGGKSGEDNSVMFTPKGEFLEIVKAIKISDLPPAVVTYVKTHYKGAKITEAGKVTDAKGKQTFEAEVNRKDLIFDLSGNYIGKD